MNQDQTINLNQNSAECIKSAMKFGETIYTNICNGNVSHVAWGGVDWVIAFGLTSFCIAFIFLVVTLIVAILTAVTE